MKILFKILLGVALTTAASSCSSFLDINTNPNSPTAVLPDAILAQALSATASIYSTSYNAYSSFTADYWAKSGVVNGYTEERTYNYTTSYYQGLWIGTYDNIQDYNLIQVQGAAGGYPNHAAIGRIMKVYDYLLLVDQYGDIPYTNALQGANNLTPSYSKAADIYKDLLLQLTGAISDINMAAAIAGVRTVGAEDIVFQGDMKQWKRFANSLQLRILLRESQTSDATLTASVVSQLSALQNAADGFITADVVVQPGYTQSLGQQNPFYTSYGFTAAGTNATLQLYQIPTNYLLAQYINNNDPRVSQLYTLGSRSGTSAFVGTDAGERNPPLFTAPLIASRFLPGGGLLKGLNAPTPLMLLSEHLFSKAEAETRNLFTGGDAAAKSDYLDGIKASFIYFYRAASATPGTLAASTTATAGVAQYNAYIADAVNATNPLVNFDNATVNGTLGKQNIIIYQKYLALNTVASTEAWDDYRRTAQPKIQASLESTSPRADKLPTRLLYPLTEVATNPANIPTGVTQYTKIFWDVVD